MNAPKNSSSVHLDPAASIIRRLGGVDIVARERKVDRTRVFRWMYPVERGGTGGVIPPRHIIPLMEFAEKRGKRLRRADFC